MLYVLKRALLRFRDECQATGYEVLLEADVAGWMFHVLLKDSSVRPQNVHLGARVCGAGGFYDVAIGDLDCESAKRPCVRPGLVIEIKVFPRIGFTPQQHRVHYKHVIEDDIPKLGKLRNTRAVKVEVLIDGAGYLNGFYAGESRKDHAARIRDEVARDVHIFIVRREGSEWEMEHLPPRN
jgi:hypothetical protein